LPNTVASVGRLTRIITTLALTNSQFKGLEDIANTVVGGDPGNPVRLKDVVEVPRVRRSQNAGYR
jgi:multidrug efflux pump subunit AcrB